MKGRRSRDWRACIAVGSVVLILGAADGGLAQVGPSAQDTSKALFMTVWCPDSRSVESNCGIPRG